MTAFIKNNRKDKIIVAEGRSIVSRAWNWEEENGRKKYRGNFRRQCKYISVMVVVKIDYTFVKTQ